MAIFGGCYSSRFNGYTTIGHGIYILKTDGKRPNRKNGPMGLINNF